MGTRHAAMLRLGPDHSDVVWDLDQGARCESAISCWELRTRSDCLSAANVPEGASQLPRR